MSKTTDALRFSDRASWRLWLKENHDRSTEAWLFIRKKSSNADIIMLEDAVLEALCFGWIDGQLASRDEATYFLRFSPRRPDSVWSLTNIRRVEQLIADDLMTESGLEKVRQGKDSGQWKAAMRREQVERIPSDLENALRERPGCLEAYRDLPKSRKQQLIYWLETAKRRETRERRIRAIVEETTA